MTKRIKQVAEDLEVSTQTIRNYLKLGDEFFSERATAKTRKRFNDDDIRQLQTIKQLLADDLTYAEIPEQLTPAARIVDPDPIAGDDANYEVSDDANHDAGVTEDTTAEDAPPTTALAKRYEQTIASQQQTIILQNDYIENLKSDKERLQDENDRLRTQLEDERLPWWSRLFGKN